ASESSSKALLVLGGRFLRALHVAGIVRVVGRICVAARHGETACLGASAAAGVQELVFLRPAVARCNLVLWTPPPAAGRDQTLGGDSFRRRTRLFGCLHSFHIVAGGR